VTILSDVTASGHKTSTYHCTVGCRTLPISSVDPLCSTTVLRTTNQDFDSSCSLPRDSRLDSCRPVMQLRSVYEVYSMPTADTSSRSLSCSMSPCTRVRLGSVYNLDEVNVRTESNQVKSIYFKQQDAQRNRQYRHTESPTHRHTEKQTNRQTNRHTDRQTDRHTDTQSHRHIDTQTNRHTDRQTQLSKKR